MPDDTKQTNEQEELFRYRLKDFFDKIYVSKDEFTLVRILVFGCAGLILTGFILFLTNFAFSGPKTSMIDGITTLV